MKFILDSMFGRLARMLRMLGYDTVYIRDNERVRLKDPELLKGRVLVTKDSRTKFGTTDIFVLAETDPLKQLDIMKDRYNLGPGSAFTVCMECNAPLDNAEKENVYGKIPPRVFESHNGYTKCPACMRIYWRGTHYAAMVEKIKKAGFIFRIS